MFRVGVVASCRCAIAGDSGALLLVGLLLRGATRSFLVLVSRGVGGRGQGGGGVEVVGALLLPI